MNNRRYACAMIPDFPIAIWIYQDPQLANRPFAIAETEKDASPLIICSAKALETGISAAMTASQAHSRCPDLIIKLRDYKKEAELSRLIVKKLQTLSPFVEEDSATASRQAGTPDVTAKSKSSHCEKPPRHSERSYPHHPERSRRTRGDEAISVNYTPGIFVLDASGLRFI